MQIMLDYETLGTAPDSVILSCGAVKFDPFSDEEPSQPFYVRLNVDEQTELGRQVDPSTVEWWSKQSAEAQAEAFSEENRISLLDFTSQLSRYVVGAGRIWAQGTTFDITLTENLYRMMGIPVPWDYWRIRDSRTLFDLGNDSIKKNNANAHNALADAFCQAQSVQIVFKQLGIKPKVDNR